MCLALQNHLLLRVPYHGQLRPYKPWTSVSLPHLSCFSGVFVMVIRKVNGYSYGSAFACWDSLRWTLRRQFRKLCLQRLAFNKCFWYNVLLHRPGWLWTRHPPVSAPKCWITKVGPHGKCGPFGGDYLWEESAAHRGPSLPEKLQSRSGCGQHFLKILRGRQGRTFNHPIRTEWICVFFPP